MVLNMKRLCLTLGILAILLFHHKGHGEEPSISIGVSEIPFLLGRTQSQRGPYNDALDKISILGQQIEIVYLPPARAEILYARKNISCLFPGSLESVDGKEHMIESNPLAVVHAFIFSLDKPLSSSNLNGQRVAIRRGFTFGGIRKVIDAKFVEVEPETAAIKFLMRQRVIAVIGYLPDILGAQKALKLDDLVLHRSDPIYSANEAFICHKTHKNINFVNDVNRLFPHKD